MEIAEIYKKYLQCAGVSTDTRQIGNGSMFFALKGANFNGNAFAANALKLGAKYAVIYEPEYQLDDRYILVPDALEALQRLANHHRRQFKIPFIAITGSNGKTTTKELVNAVLSAKYKAYATKGNLNNHIGIPLTLLAIKPDVEIAIIEMGANHQKEIEGYCKIAEPTHGLITNIGKAHLEGFGGFEGVKKGKGELYDYLLKTNGIAFINSTNEVLKGIAKFSKPVNYPQKGDFYSSSFVEASPFIKVQAENGELVTTQIIGAYNFENIAAALCIGKYFNVPADAANKAVAAYDPQNNRSQAVTQGTNTLVMDAYNANPSSMKAAIENFAKLEATNKAVLLGDMFELGDESKIEHENLGKLLKSLSGNFSKILLVGTQMQFAKEQVPSANYFETKEALLDWLKQKHFEHSTILIKGSRGMGLEVVREVL